MSDVQLICDIYNRCNAKGKKIIMEVMKIMEAKPNYCVPAAKRRSVEKQMEQAINLANGWE